jgi:hypothetical protein
MKGETMKVITTTTERNKRRAEQAAKHRAKCQQVATTARPGTHDEITSAVRSTHLKYAWDYKWEQFTLTRDTEVTVHEGCTQFTMTLPAGTVGWHHAAREHVYDKYVRIDDMSLPAKGAKPIKTTHYHSWTCLVQVDGKWCLAEAFATRETTHSSI